MNLIEQVTTEIRRRGFKRVALFGTRFTVASRLFGQLEGVSDVVAPMPEDLDSIHEAYTRLVSDAAGSAQTFEKLREIAHTLCHRDGAEAIVFAGAELSLVFNESNTDFPHIDCAGLHIDAIMRRLDTATEPRAQEGD